jgi:hypothetical protein
LIVGILDELRKEAESKKQLAVDDAELAARREKTYQQILLPTLQKMLKSIQEVLELLPQLGPVVVENYSSKRPEIGKLVQGEYRINTDGRSGFEELSKLRQINLSFRMKGPGSYQYTIIGRLAAETELEFLHARNMKVETTSRTDANGVVTMTFSVPRDIPVWVSFVVDYDNSTIKFSEYNQENFSSSTQSFPVTSLSKDWIDDFLRFLLRKDNKFATRLTRRFPT